MFRPAFFVMKKCRYIFIILVLSVLTSCVSKNFYHGYDKQKMEKLSHCYGVKLTAHDNMELYDAGNDWLGVRYRRGGMSKKGVDCSGLTGILYQQVYGIKLQRSSASILKQDCKPVSRDELREGDLVFFNTLGPKGSKTPTHVGVYLKNGKFIHSTTRRGVMVSSLSEPYYVRQWLTGGRVTKK